MTRSPSNAASSRDADPDLRLTHLFFLLCSAMIAAFGLWAHYGRLDVVSTAVGEVIPSSQIKSVQHLEGGIVREIMVREGEAVKKGQPLVSLEPTSSGADVDELRVRMTSLTLDVGRLEAEVSGAEAPILPERLMKEYPGPVAESLALFNTRRSRFNNQLAGQHERISQDQEQIQEITSRIENNAARLRLLREQIKISESLMKEQLTNRMQHIDLLKESTALTGRITEDQGALRRAQSALIEARTKLEAIRDAFQEKVQSELEQKRRGLEEYASRARKFADSLRRTVLRSPVDGIVKSLYVFTVGGVLPPGGTVVDIVPGGDRMIIEARLPPQEIGYVNTGQKALVTLASNDATRFGHIAGSVVNISPDTIQTDDGKSFYKVRIATERDYFEHNASRYRLVPGVQVVTSIRTGERSVLAYITDPFMESVRTAMRER